MLSLILGEISYLNGITIHLYIQTSFRKLKKLYIVKLNKLLVLLYYSKSNWVIDFFGQKVKQEKRLECCNNG